MSPNRPGRPRDERVDAAILQATRALLAETGYAGLTVAAVAARAGIGKAAIYRRYATKQEMVFAATMHGAQVPQPPDTGSLRADLRWLAGVITGMIGAPGIGGVLGGLLADMEDEAVATAMRGFAALQRATIALILDRAAARGELPRAPDPAFVHAAMMGAIFARLHVFGEGDPEGFADTLAGTVAGGLTHPDEG